MSAVRGEIKKRWRLFGGAPQKELFLKSFPKPIVWMEFNSLRYVSKVGQVKLLKAIV